MKLSYDADVDILYIKLTNAKIVDSDEEDPGVIVDYDAAGGVVGLEILDISRYVRKPSARKQVATK